MMLGSVFLDVAVIRHDRTILRDNVCFPKIKTKTWGAFHLRKKPGNFGGSKSGISDWQKVVPFGRKPRYVAGCPTVDLELAQTTRNVNGTRHSVRKFQPGKRDHLFRFSTFSGNFPVGRTDETCSIYRRTRNSGNFE